MAPISDIERQVYTDIYQTYSGKLYGVCLHYVNDRETAEDLLHDSFIVIFSSLDSLRDSSRLEAWMCSIVRNIACQYLKKAQRMTETSIDGTSGKVKMMHAEGSFEHSSNHIWSTVKLPYGNGSYSMYILLPHEDKTVSDVISALDGKAWKMEKNTMGTKTVDLKLPAFETATEVNLVNIMKSLGMTRAFDPYHAEFNEMLELPDGSLYLGLLKQKSKIKVNEEGTEAAAVTVGGFFANSVQPPAEHVTFHADRPFIYLIQEQSSNAIFFIGTKVRS